jgi:hypothetical protein
MAGDNAKPETGAPSRVTGSALRPEAPGSGDDGQGEVAARPDGSAGGSLSWPLPLRSGSISSSTVTSAGGEVTAAG